MKKVIRFTAKWCSPCKIYAPTFDKVASSTPGVQFQTIDVDTEHDLVLKYGIKNIPTTVILENDIVLRRSGGNLSEEALRNLIY